MLKNCEKWRKEFKVDELYASWNMPDEERHAILSAWPQCASKCLLGRHSTASRVERLTTLRPDFHRTDREGRPMYIQQCNVTPEALFSAANETRLIEYFAMTFESVIRHRYAACAEASGRYIDSTFIVFSMQDVSLKNFWTIRNFIIKLAQYSQGASTRCPLVRRALIEMTRTDYFPCVFRSPRVTSYSSHEMTRRYSETSGKIRIINAGMLFSSMYASLTPFLAKVTTDVRRLPP